MLEDVVEKQRKGNVIFFSRSSICLQPLIDLICKQNHRTMVLWAFDCVEIPHKQLKNKYPNETRWRQAIVTSDKWSKGEVKMRIAQRAILDAHAVAKDLDDPIDQALCHAIGQATATTHVETHALGLPFYELTAIVLENPNDYEQKVLAKIQYYIDRLNHWSKEEKQIKRSWAPFLLNEKENRELALKEKKKSC